MLYNLSYYSLLYSSIGSILDYTYINQLASSNSSLSSHNIILKASVIITVVRSLYILASIYYLVASTLVTHNAKTSYNIREYQTQSLRG